MPLPQVYAATTGDKIKGVISLPFRIIGWIIFGGMMFEFGNIGTLLFIVIFAFFEYRLIETLWRNRGTSPAALEITAPPTESLTPREELLRVLGRVFKAVQQLSA